MPKVLVPKPKTKVGPKQPKKINKKKLIFRGVIGKNKYVFYGILLFTIIGTSLFFSSKKINLAISNTDTKTNVNKDFVDLHIAQYSDSHITPSAILSDPKLAYSYSYKPNLTANVIGALSSAIPTRAPGKEYGTWLWTSPISMTDDYMDSIISGAKSNGINVIYISIDSYLDVFSTLDASEKIRKTKVFSDKLETFIKKANSVDIKVDAEAGWRNWAEKGNTYKGFVIIDFVKNFNETQKYKFRGFQYDVEPYLLDEYKTDQSTVLKNFLNLITESIYHLQSTNILFSVVIPDFYDRDQKLTEPFVYNGKEKYVYNHLLDVMENRPQSAIIIMAYRNIAKGTDGSINVSNTEIRDVVNGNYNTKIIVAQETGDVKPPYITYNNTSKKYYERQVQEIQNAFSSYESFGGIAVHYVNAFMSLR
jgi:hypothetical protein